MINRNVKQPTTSFLCTLLVGAVFAGGTQPAFAVEVKDVACVNMQTLFQRYYKTYQYQEKLAQKRQELEGDAQDMKRSVDEIEKQKQKLDERLQNPVLNQDARSQIKAELRAKNNLLEAKKDDLRSFMSENVESLKKEYMEKRNEIVDEIRGIIRSYAESRDLDLVFDVSGMTSNLIPTVLHYPEEADVTKEVLERLNEGHEDEVPDQDVGVPLEGNLGVPPTGSE